jgi:hypothetical protein
MEFYCVMSISGSLASYHVQMENDTAFKAVLRNNNGKRTDIPAEISLKKNGDAWQAEPWHEEVVQSLIHAVESNDR